MKFLFYCLVGIILALVAVKAETDEELDKLMEACRQVVPTTDEEIQTFIKSDMDPAMATEAIKCHSKCVLEKQGFFSHGSFDDQAFIKSTQNTPELKDRQTQVAKVVGECKKDSLSGTNDCETAFKAALCLRVKKEEVFGKP